jgi:hypothetical protein
MKFKLEDIAYTANSFIIAPGNTRAVKRECRNLDEVRAFSLETKRTVELYVGEKHIGWLRMCGTKEYIGSCAQGEGRNGMRLSRWETLIRARTVKGWAFLDLSPEENAAIHAFLNGGECPENYKERYKLEQEIAK